MKVLYLTNLPVPYRVEFFNILGKEIDLTVIFDRDSAMDREDSWLSNNIKYFTGYFLNSWEIGNENSISFEIFKYLKRDWDIIVIGTHVSYTALVAMLYMRLRGIRFVFNCDGGVFYEGESKIKKAIKKFFVQSAECYLSTGKITDQWFRYYGADSKCIYRYPFAAFDEKYISKSKSEKWNIRRKLGIPLDKKVIISVGRFIDLKGFDVLIKAFKSINHNAVLYIIGGSFPKKEWLPLLKLNGNEQIKFIEFQDNYNLTLWYQAADIFVLATRRDSWGLVINEAMAHGLPVITTNRCNAGLELINDYENGFIFEVDDYNQLTDKINMLLENDALCIEQGENNKRKIKNYTLEKMVTVHLNVFKEILKNR